MVHVFPLNCSLFCPKSTIFFNKHGNWACCQLEQQPSRDFSPSRRTRQLLKLSESLLLHGPRKATSCNFTSYFVPVPDSFMSQTQEMRLSLSEPGRLNRLQELTGMAAAAKLWSFLPLPSHRTQDQSPWLTELISTCRFQSAGKLMYRLIIQATRFREEKKMFEPSVVS